MFETATAFAVVARNTQEYIQRENLSERDGRPFQMGSGLTPQKVWVAMRSALDFNFHQAIELCLKLVLKANGVEYRHSHNLVSLFRLLPREAKDDLEQLHKEYFVDSVLTEIELVAFKVSPTMPEPPSSNPIDLNSIEGILAFFDQELALYKRRYGWETVGRGEWLRFVSDIRPWLALLDGLIKYCLEVIKRTNPNSRRQERDSTR